MAHRALILALSTILAASPLSAATQDQVAAEPAPAGGPDTRYCMRIEPVTGSRIETIECWTRQEWAEQGVDVDLEWAREGVRVI